MVLCFGVHPQLVLQDPHSVGPSLEYLHALIAEKRIAAIGEIGFDLFDQAYRATEGAQESLFRAELALAVEYALPVVLHIRKAMHKVFAYSRELARLPAVVLHSYSGTLREAVDLRSRGIAAYFSFGTPIALNHKRAMEAVARLPAETLLVETDAPYQALKGSRFPDARPYSSWTDLTMILHEATELRRNAGSSESGYGELEKCCDGNFRLAYGLSGNDGIR
jgi:TatD DNase family protein